MKPTDLVEQMLGEGETPFDTLNRLADELFAEFGFATLDADDKAKLVDMKRADALAKQRGEFGLATMDENSMRELINANPSLLRTSGPFWPKEIKGRHPQELPDDDDTQP